MANLFSNFPPGQDKALLLESNCVFNFLNLAYPACDHSTWNYDIIVAWITDYTCAVHQRYVEESIITMLVSWLCTLGSLDTDPESPETFKRLIGEVSVLISICIWFPQYLYCLVTMCGSCGKDLRWAMDKVMKENVMKSTGQASSSMWQRQWEVLGECEEYKSERRQKGSKHKKWKGNVHIILTRDIWVDQNKITAILQCLA